MAQAGISYRFGPFRADPRERVLRRGDEIVPLTPTVFEILLVMLRNPGRVLTKDEMIRRIWPDTSVEESNLTRNISSLRKALGERRDRRQYIETVPWRGYRFVAGVEEVSESLKSGDALAVLPFEGTGLEAGSEYLPDGVTSILIDRLSMLPGLKVLSGSAVFRYRERNRGLPDLDVAGRELGVRALVTGRIVQHGSTLVVDVEMLDSQDSSHIWGARYHHAVGNLRALELAISRDIADRLRLRLTPADRERLGQPGTRDPEAYRLYLRGRFFAGKLTLEGIRTALELFEQAISRDPAYALAYAGLVKCHTYLGDPAAARRAATRALDLDPALAEAHASLGFAAFLYDWNWTAAEQGFTRAIDLNPSYAEAHHWYAIYLAHMGRHKEALREACLARELDPISLMMHQTLGNVLCLARDYGGAIAALSETIAMDENYAAAHGTRGMVYAEQGMFEEALADFEKVLALAGHAPPVAASLRAMIGYAYATSGRRDAALKIAGEVASADPPALPYAVAVIYARAGDADRALEWLEKAYAARSFELVGLGVSAGVDSLRSDPRFHDLISRVGLPPGSASSA